MSVSEAQRKIDSAEFTEWIAFNNIEQFTANKTENMLAVVACILANVNRKAGSAAYSPLDFLPKYSTPGDPKDQGLAMEIKLRAILNGNNQ